MWLKSLNRSAKSLSWVFSIDVSSKKFSRYRFVIFVWRFEPKWKTFLDYSHLNPKPSLKIRTASAICLETTAKKNIFFRKKKLLFFKIESWNFQHLFENVFRETSQSFNSVTSFRQLSFTFFSLGCLIELKFCEVSWNSLSTRCWKFQLSILKNKKVLFLKKYFFGRKSISKQKSFVYQPNFQWRFWSRVGF